MKTGPRSEFVGLRAPRSASPATFDPSLHPVCSTEWKLTLSCGKLTFPSQDFQPLSVRGIFAEENEIPKGSTAA